SIRLPSAARYAAHVEVEQTWLPRLAPRLPLPIPSPLATGEPSAEYPWPWSVNRWLDGEQATVERIGDLDEFAVHLAQFLNALQVIDATGAPAPGRDNFFRGGELSVYERETRECISELGDLIDAQAATALLEAALATKWDREPVWFHGDVAVGNLLTDNRGKLCAVIDFGQLAAGDPSCDLTIAWTLLSGSSRQTFRKERSVDEATWARGRGWGLWKALLQLRSHSGNEAARALAVINEILAD
ncbi:MAG: aminoglycoside phosphotransferase family protein, partial [Gammaproteobacteria bacterium]|nr:aminoglycoside phosphotransferase family protein [Gammaproteobacteria bacterium]